MTTIDLPFPPSVNRLWRVAGRRIVLSKPYATWIKKADQFVLYTKQRKGTQIIAGHFAALVTLDQNQRNSSDADNFSKALLDYAQRIELISNDKFCDEITIRWGDVPFGCRVVLTEVVSVAGEGRVAA